MFSTTACKLFLQKRDKEPVLLFFYNTVTRPRAATAQKPVHTPMRDITPLSHGSLRFQRDTQEISASMQGAHIALQVYLMIRFKLTEMIFFGIELCNGKPLLA